MRNNLEPMKIDAFRMFTGAGVAASVLPRLAADMLKQAPIHGLLYAPRACRFARLEGDGDAARLEIGAPADVEPEDAYEIRLFNALGELRWVRDGETGEVAVLLEDAGNGADTAALLRTEPPFDAIWRQSGRQILWGRELPDAPPRPGWTTLADPRTGAFAVPVAEPLADNERLALETRSYFIRPADRDGNLALLSTRLRGFKRVAPEPIEQEDEE